MNKKKIFNDPVYGFVTIPCDLIFDIIEHPYFQRLRRIRQLGMTDFVYPGALHTRLHHAIGAMHLMGIAMQTLQGKGHEISSQECEAAQIAILLHDIGHGPFSHALENSIMTGIPHERLSLLIMQQLNKEFNGALDLAIKMFTNTYDRTFFHQLVSSQLDTDRLDYLKRDSFFTGVSEGSIGASRILRMLEVRNNKLVVEEKGIYSIENFLNARRLMYWQVYLHKTTVSAEQMLIQIIRRARYLSQQGVDLSASDSLTLFLKHQVKLDDFLHNPQYLQAFTSLDDHDIMASVKRWMHHPDRILSMLSSSLINRKLFKIQLSNEAFDPSYIHALQDKVFKEYGLSDQEMNYIFLHGHISNAAYVLSDQTINILTKRGEVVDVSVASDLPNIKAMSKIVKKYYLCWPKHISL